MPGLRAGLWFLAHLLCLPAALACPGPALSFQALGPGLWWIPAAADGDADGANRGHISHLLLAEDGPRLWLVGSGPTPAFGRRLACQVQQHFGRAVTDVISPWPRPELVLGVAGLGAVRHWAHADVASALRQRCPGCIQGLQARLGAAAGDLAAAGDAPAAVPVPRPTHRFRGHSGRLGPWQWWRSTRGAGVPLTLWQYRGSDLRFAPGLLWGSGVPDGRDADIARLAASTAALPADVPRWLGEQGPLLGAEAPAAQADYWRRLRLAIQAALARGDADDGRPPLVDGLAPALAQDPRHALNAQRTWRQEEASEAPSPRRRR